MHGEPYPRSWFNREAAADLFDKQRNQLQPERADLGLIEILRQADAVVGDNQDEFMFGGGLQFDADFASAAIREGMFEGIGDQFVHNQSAGYGAFEVDKLPFVRQYPGQRDLGPRFVITPG